MKNLVLSVHDVSPLTWETTRALLNDLKEVGLTRFSLLVIPNHHHRGHFLENTGFCDWLKAQAAEGQEIVIHGYYHQRSAKPAESALVKFMTRFYTANEGEFYDIGKEAARALVGKAREEFATLGLEPAGFIAPAWLLSGPAEEALRELGFLYTTRLGGVIRLQGATLHPSQSMVYSVRSAWRCQMSLAWNALLYQRLGSNGLLRIGVHPVDFFHPSIWKQIRNRVVRTLAQRTAITYEDWVRAQG